MRIIASPHCLVNKLSSVNRGINFVNTVKKGYSMEPENVPFYGPLPFIYMSMLQTLLINGQHEVFLYR